MTNLGTKYLGLKLKNPVVVSASPLSKEISHLRQMEDCGAAAVVMHSLFEEQISL
jgi:dihydroorotate dehydrogenase (fumarate)